MPDNNTLSTLLIIAGITTSISSLCNFRALKLGEASAVSPLERLSVLFAVIFGAVILKEKLRGRGDRCLSYGLRGSDHSDIEKGWIVC